MSKLLFNKICVVGVGLIGGSVALAVKKRMLARVVVGVARRKKKIEEALEKKAINIGTLDLKRGVEGADLVILAGPVSTIVGQIKTLSRSLDKKTVVIDVGSSKEKIEQAEKKYLKKNIFVGCHPMAGLEKKGVLFAEPDLFEGAVCFMTGRHARVEAFWRALGCVPTRIGAHEHDAWVAQFSHLPHVLAFTLFQKSPHRPGSLKASNPSLRDLARISKSDPRLWSDIFFSNRSELLSAIAHFQKDLRGLENALRSRQLARVIAYIRKANQISHRLAPNVDHRD